jgi:signal transduction histidine kinase
MFQRPVYPSLETSVSHPGDRALLVFLLWIAIAGISVTEARGDLVSRRNDSTSARPLPYLTNAVQFRALTSQDYLNPCAFHLAGVVTLVDSNRNLVVLQDATGALAINFQSEQSLEVGQLVSFEGTNCYPYVVSFPDYPFRPSGRDVRNSFEAPTDWGEYHLTRMRAHLHPPVSGEYTFWIASDNSSELWLSPDEDPSKARKIASIPRYGWVGPREWSRFPSQRSESILLESGQSYYIEALQEQTTYGDHLSVAWQGPELKQSVISDRHLTPWAESREQFSPGETNGVLREYWTNFSAGNLGLFTATRSFESALSVEKARVTVLGKGKLPKAGFITLNERMLPADNYRWVEAEGRVKFIGLEGDVAFLELSDGQAQIQVRARHWNPELSRDIRRVPIRVEGVCEGVYDRNGVLVPGLIWVSTENGISLIEAENEIPGAITVNQPPATVLTSTNPAMLGFFGTRGVVTFNDRVFDKDYLFVQEATVAVSISLKNRSFKNELKTGQWVELGGALQPDKSVPVISPLVVLELGWRSMPAPISQPVQFPVPENCEGRWTEVEGIVHSANANGTLSLMGKAGLIYLWIGRTPANELTRYVDSKLRVRGVLTSGALNAPLLLVPSRNYVDVEAEAPADPFGLPARSIASLFSDPIDSSAAQRVKFVGTITYRDRQSFFIQDQSGGVRVQTGDAPMGKVGDTIEAVGFPTMSGAVPTLTGPLVRPAGVSRNLEPKKLDLNAAVSFRQIGTLIHVSGNLLGKKTAGSNQILELQEQQRVFEATLDNDLGELPPIAPGSRLGIVGMCDYGTMTVPAAGRAGVEKSSTGALNIRLRSVADIVVLSGPPWWTWRRTATLVGSLFLVLTGAFLWIHLLRGRLERQRATQRAFSQQMLENLERERHRIAGNLHDGLGQNLLVIKNQALLGLQNDADGSVLRQRLDEISGFASQAIEEVRQITHGLRPYQLDRLGLTQAIRAAVIRTSTNSPILFASRTEDIDAVFDRESEIHVYRIVQEAVNNVVKHSGATEAVVVIKKRENSVSLSIRDNGRGFDVGLTGSGQPHELGYGLSGITERVRILGGTFAVDSRPGSGTHLTIEIPMPTRKHDAGSDHTSRR